MNRPVQQYYEFDQYRLGTTERLLTRSGEVVSLPPKAVELLFALVENHSHLVTKQELIERIWPDSFVEEANLSRNIFLLRKVFNGDGKSFIETYPRRGYRFM